jgi:hypothetical protein
MVVTTLIMGLVAVASSGEGGPPRPLVRAQGATPMVESIEVRTLGFRPVEPGQETRSRSGAMQLTNPETGTTCTLLVVPAPPNVDPKMTHTLDTNVDPGILAPPPPCAQPLAR